MRDVSMRDEVKTRASAIGEALAATFNTVADEIRKAIGKE